MPSGTKPAPNAFALALHAQLRAWTERRGLSFRQLAEVSGVSRGRIQRSISADKTPLDVSELHDICKVLKIPPKNIVEAIDGTVTDNKSTEPTELSKLVN